tara:strand:+ start:45 stop:251 length:207 start_codon:yes stop_codon:yes gene_type:complete
MSNCQKCTIQNELPNEKNYSDEVAIWTELDIKMPKKYYSLCEYCYQVITEKDGDISDVIEREKKHGIY